MIKKNKIAGLIVTYLPNDFEIENIFKTSKLVDVLYVIDNSCDKFISNKIIQKNTYSNIIYIANKKNLGIGFSANMFFKHIKDKFEWCILLDQDSVINLNFYKILDILNKKNIYIAGLNHTEKLILKNNHYDYTLIRKRRIIFSGTLLNKKIFNKYKFKENLFLDMTDFTFCQKLIKDKIKIYIFNNIFFEHHVGNTRVNKFLFFRKKRTNHPPINCFLMARNRILLYKENLYPSSLAKILIKQIKEIIYTFIFEDQSLRKISARLKGIFFGLKSTSFDSIESIKKILN